MNARAEMQKSLEYLQNNLISIHSVFDIGLISSVKIKIDGQSYSLQDIALTDIRNHNILVRPYDHTKIKTFEDQLKKAGFNACIFSKSEIVVYPPPISGEEKEKKCLYIKKMGEETKISFRNIRKKYKQDAKGLSKDELNKLEKNLNELTNEFETIVDELIKNKQKVLR